MNLRNPPASSFGTKSHTAIWVVSDKESPQTPQPTNSTAQPGSARTHSYLYEDSVVTVTLSACPGLTSQGLQNGHRSHGLQCYSSCPAPHPHLSLLYGPHSLYHYLNHSYSFVSAFLFIYLSSVDCKPHVSKDYVLLTTVSQCLECAWHIGGARLKAA